jgi:hypothetical protein
MQELKEGMPDYKTDAYVEIEEKENRDRKKIYLALSGSMVALGSASVGYAMFGSIIGLGFVLMVMGSLWYIQTQLETAIESIEIQIKKDE